MNDSGMALKDLRPGERGRVGRISGAGAVNRRIRDMGITKGCVIEVVRVAPLGDPVDVKVRGYRLSLRKAEAAGIEVEKC